MKTTANISQLLTAIRLGNPFFETADAFRVAAEIIDVDGFGINGIDHWQKCASALLTAAILHVLYTQPDKTLYGVATFLNAPDMDDAFKAMIQTEHDPEGRFHWVDGAGQPTKVHPIIAKSAMEMLDRRDNEKAGIMTTLLSAIYRQPAVYARFSEAR